jgi:conjugative relaxase-like TrwC/TraI family protein
MSAHLVTETDIPELQTKLAEYYANGMKPDAAHQTAAITRADMNAGMANLLGIDPSGPLSVEQVTHLLTGLRADGEAIPGKQVQKTKDRAQIAYIDLTFSAPKSLSVAIAFAPTEAERAILDRAHRDAVDTTLAHISTVIGVARKGKGGSKGADPGHIAWVQFDHFTARPTIKMPVMENGVPATEIHTIRVAGDPQGHTHVIVRTLC